MNIKRLMSKSNENCSCCGNKSVKPFEVLIIENVLKEHILYICNNCQKYDKLETKELGNLTEDKIFIG